MLMLCDAFTNLWDMLILIANDSGLVMPIESVRHLSNKTVE
jgi:hypothetical protein